MSEAVQRPAHLIADCREAPALLFHGLSTRLEKHIAVHRKWPYDAPMPAKNPRLTITLEPQIGAQLRRLSELTGNSQSQLISELLEDAESVFAKMIQVLEAAQAVRDDMRGRITLDIEQAQCRMERQLGLSIEEPVDTRTLPLLADVEKVARRRRKQADAPAGGQLAGTVQARVTASVSSETPLSNRGVRSPRRAA